MTQQERDLVVRMLMSEAGNQGPTGMEAVAAVIRNRANQSGMSPGQVVTAKGQFEPWGTASGRAKLAGYDPNSSAYQQAASAFDRAMNGSDPTGGATHFYSPKVQAALGRKTPAWARGPGQDIGDHRFYKLGYAPPQPPTAPQPPAPPTPPQAEAGILTGSRHDDGTREGHFSESDPAIKEAAKALGLDDKQTEGFKLGLALGGRDPFPLFGGFENGGWGAEGLG